MSSRFRLRFVARIDGNIKELVSVSEMPSGALLVSSGVPKFWENDDGSFTQFDEQHYSVHLSNEGQDTTITQKTSLVDGRHYSNVAYIPDTKESLLWPIYARRPPMLAQNTRTLNARKKDHVIEIADYRSQNASLMYSVFVSKSVPDMTTSPISHSTIFYWSFSKFTIIVIASYLNLPSLQEGDVVGFATSSQVVNGKKEPLHYQIETSSLPQIALVSTHLTLMDKLINRMDQRIARVFKNHIGEYNSLKNMMNFLTREPIIK